MMPIFALPTTKKYQEILLSFALVFFLTGGLWSALQAQSPANPKKYYIHAAGKDSNPGTFEQPWQTLGVLMGLRLHPGDRIYLQGGQTFKGSIQWDAKNSGTPQQPIRIGSYGKGRASIDAGNQTAITLNQCKCIHLENLVLKGNGRRKGNFGRGLWINGGRNISLDKLDVHGFQKSGVEITDCSHIRLHHIQAYDNGYAGISVTGTHFPALSNQHIYISHCEAYNNPGDPTEINNHSGNGIVVGLAKDVLIEYCVATNNGWDMPRVGNGPVGIWAWEADSVTIQHCIAYRNRTAPGAADGGGFDLDGGVTNSIVQYNLAYENEGYGYGIFQFSGATPWHHNTFRYNVSFNDGNTTQNGASVLWWNGSNDSTQFHDCYFYNNLLYNSKGYVLGVVPKEYQNSRFMFLNNIFVGKDELMSGGTIGSEAFYGNDWWSIQSGFKVNGVTDFARWAHASGKEVLNQQLVGLNLNPRLSNPVSPTLKDPALLHLATGLRLDRNSPLRDKGLDLIRHFGLNAGGRDFFGNPVPSGASCEPGMAELK